MSPRFREVWWLPWVAMVAAIAPRATMAQLVAVPAAAAYDMADQSPLTRELDRLLESADKAKKLDDLATYARKAVQERPNWMAGKVALALIEQRRGKTDEAKAVLEELLADKSRHLPSILVMTAGPKLAGEPSLRPLVIRMYQQGIIAEEVLQYRNSPAPALVSLLCQENRKDEARRFLVGFAERQLPRNIVGESLALMQIQDRQEIARELERIGCPMDALLIYRRIAEPAKPNENAGRFVPDFRKQIEREIQRLERELPPEAVLALLPEVSKLSAPATQQAARPVIELLVYARRDPSGEAMLASPVANALTATAQKPELRQQASRQLAALAAARPDDFSIAVAAALLQLASGSAPEQAKAVENVVALVQKHPLPASEPSARVTDAERAQAAEQLPVALVAEACLQHESLKPQAEELSGRALEAVARMADKSLTSAVLARLGAAAFAHKDPKASREELLRILQSRMKESGATVASSSINTVTLESFNEIADLAVCASNVGLPEVSAECIRRALEAGPPCEHSRPGEMAVAVPGMGFHAAARPSRATLTQVAQTLSRMDQRWKEKGLAPAVAYETLAAIMFPESRPAVVWVYSAAASAKSPSVAELLVARAKEAGKLDDLEKRLASRKPDPDTALSCLGLKFEIALARRDTATAQQILKEMATQLKGQGSMEIARMMVPVATSALKQNATRPAAEELIRQISAKLTGGSSWGDRIIRENAPEETPKSK